MFSWFFLYRAKYCVRYKIYSRQQCSLQSSETIRKHLSVCVCVWVLGRKSQVAVRVRSRTYHSGYTVQRHLLKRKFKLSLKILRGGSMWRVKRRHCVQRLGCRNHLTLEELKQGPSGWTWGRDKRVRRAWTWEGSSCRVVLNAKGNQLRVFKRMTWSDTGFKADSI